MKKSEFRALLREEIRKVMRENKRKSLRENAEEAAAAAANMDYDGLDKLITVSKANKAGGTGTVKLGGKAYNWKLQKEFESGGEYLGTAIYIGNDSIEGIGDDMLYDAILDKFNKK